MQKLDKFFEKVYTNATGKKDVIYLFKEYMEMKKKNYIKNILVVATLGIAILFFINISLAANTAKVNVETANLRESADSNSKILEQLSLNEEVEILEKTGDWYKVEARNITGFLRQDLLTVNGEVTEDNNTETTTTETTNTEGEQTTNQNQDANTTDTEENKENVKKVTENTKLKIVPSINATDIIEVKQDEQVTIIETMNDWVCIQVGTTKGWIRGDKLKSVEEKTEEPTKTNPEENKPVAETVIKTAYVSETTVNLRKEANTTSEVVAKLSLNTKVDVYSEENGWSKVKANDKEGYVSTSLLSNKKKEVETTSRGATTPRKKETETKKEETNTPTAPVSGKGSTVVETAKKYIGYPYVYGASGPSSFDCSGFTSYVFKLHGVTLSRTAKGQYKNGTAVSRSNLQPGDLIMFGPSASGINHVGIYIGGGQIVHAANKTRGVTIDTINSGYYNKNYVGARRVI